MLTMTLSMLSVSASVGFVWTGGIMMFRPGPWNRILGIVSIGYGMLSVVLLLTAWLQPSPSMPAVSKYLSFVLLVTLATSLTMDAEMIAELEWLRIVLAPLMLLLNWFAVKNLVDSTPYIA